MIRCNVLTINVSEMEEDAVEEGIGNGMGCAKWETMGKVVEDTIFGILRKEVNHVQWYVICGGKFREGEGADAVCAINGAKRVSKGGAEWAIIGE